MRYGAVLWRGVRNEYYNDALCSMVKDLEATSMSTETQGIPIAMTSNDDMGSCLLSFPHTDFYRLFQRRCSYFLHRAFPHHGRLFAKMASGRMPSSLTLCNNSLLRIKLRLPSTPFHPLYRLHNIAMLGGRHRCYVAYSRLVDMTLPRMTLAYCICTRQSKRFFYGLATTASSHLR
jgi:hypothetical protein